MRASIAALAALLAVTLASPAVPAPWPPQAIPPLDLCGLCRQPERHTGEALFEARRAGGPSAEQEPNDTAATANPVAISASGTRYATISGTVGGLPTPVAFTAAPEDNGSITLASPTGLVAGTSGYVQATTAIGSTPSTGDADFFAIPAAAGQRISLEVTYSGGSFFPVMGLYRSNGQLVAFDSGTGENFNSVIGYTAPVADTYYACIVGGFSFFTSDLPSNPFNSGSGIGVVATGSYTFRAGLDVGDADNFRVTLDAGDLLAARLAGTSGRLTVTDAQGILRIATPFSTTPGGGPIPSGGNVSLAQVVPATGTYIIRVEGTANAYTLDLAALPAGLRDRPIPERQILFVDFDGATLNPSIWGGTNAQRTVSPFRSFLPNWGFAAAREEAVARAILAVLEEKLLGDTAALGLNGNFDATGRAGDFAIDIRNSYDDPDPFGQTNVTRLIIGGTNTEIGISDILGVAEVVDFGNYRTQESAIVLLNQLSAPAGTVGFSANDFAVAGGATKEQLVARLVGFVGAHEVGHMLGLSHTSLTDGVPELIDAGGLVGYAVGPDLTFGTADDINVDFGAGLYTETEAFAGRQDSRYGVAFGLSTGTVGAPGRNEGMLWIVE